MVSCVAVFNPFHLNKTELNIGDHGDDAAAIVWGQEHPGAHHHHHDRHHDYQVSKVHLDSPVDEGSCLVRQHLFTAGRDCKVGFSVFYSLLHTINRFGE